MHRLEGFEIKKKEHMVYKLKKNQYGLKQVPIQWYNELHLFMMSYDYKRQAHCYVYISQFPNGNFIILWLYVMTC